MTMIMDSLRNRLKPWVDELRHADTRRDGYSRHEHEFKNYTGRGRCYLIGTPNYANLGDLAIADAEMGFLRSVFSNDDIVEIQTGRFWEYVDCILRYGNPDRDVVCLHGGGNMGDVYSMYEYERIAVIHALHKYRIVLMPQTISYKDANSSLLRYSQSVYSKHPDLHLFARETRSLAIMHETYPKNDVALAPDIVLSLDVKPYLAYSDESAHVERHGIVTLLRNDVEKRLDDKSSKSIDQALQRTGLDITHSDTVVQVDSPVLPEQRHSFLSPKLRQIAAAQLVVTDRLHGMVFAALTDTPCVALSSNNHKVRGVYQWIKGLPYVKYAETPDQVAGFISELLALHDHSGYDREAMLGNYEALRQRLRHSSR